MIVAACPAHERRFMLLEVPNGMTLTLIVDDNSRHHVTRDGDRYYL